LLFSGPHPAQIQKSGAAIENNLDDARMLDERQYEDDGDFPLISAGSRRPK
jgi:hypothetical protein